MGIPVETELYTEADAPGPCEIDLFDGRTPKYIEAHVTEIVLCPIATCPDPNGTYVLTTADGSQYAYIDANIIISVLFQPGATPVYVYGMPGLQPLFFDAGDRCVDVFTNLQINCVLPNWGHSGTVKLFWGPGISL